MIEQLRDGMHVRDALTGSLRIVRRDMSAGEWQFQDLDGHVRGWQPLHKNGTNLYYEVPDDRTQEELAAYAAKAVFAALEYEDGAKRGVAPGDWLNSLTSAQRKQIPIGTVMREYFPDALAYVAYVAHKGNEKHNPGQPLHWSRGKSSDQEDCVARHLIGAGGRDPADGLRHSGGLAWRALALLQLEIEDALARGEEVL